MAVRTSHPKTNISSRSANYYSLGTGGDLPIARIVALLLVLLPLAAYVVASEQAKEGPSDEALQIAAFNPKQVLADNTPHFLPKPEAALSGDADAGPPPPAQAEPVAAAPPADGVERVKVANTGGVGAMLRDDPPRGRQVAGLRSGQMLEVLEHRTVADSEWLRVRTPDGSVEGWIFARLVGPAQ
jgi:hypothetical protein